MLIYVESNAFPHKTFTLVCHPQDTIARARAQMLHILYELGREDHQFRFRFKGEFLRDAYTFEDYRILDNSVIKMVPMSKKKRGSYASVFGSVASIDGASETHVFSSSAKLHQPAAETLDDVQRGLRKEVWLFTLRENLLSLFSILLWIHMLATILDMTSFFWYLFIPTGVVMVYGFYYCPTYTRLGGFVGRTGVSRHQFLISFGVAALIMFVAALTMAILLTIEVVSFECTGQSEQCQLKLLLEWSVTLYYGQAIFFLAHFILVLVLVWNFKYEVGDIIERFLVQSRDLDKIMKSAKLGRVKERRSAAFELASLAASGDETKFRIVAEGGLEALMNLALSTDQATQEYATEALAELLIIRTIQDQFVDSGGVRTLCALLHSKNTRVTNEAVTAISYIVADSEDNRDAIVSDNGLEDLAYIAERIAAPASRIVAGIFLELAFSGRIRTYMASMETPANALVSLCRSRDSETERLSLQTLELLAIENSDIIIHHEELLEYLVSLPAYCDDEQLFLLSGKILLYYAENEMACKNLLLHDDLKSTLLEYSLSQDPLLQNVTTKIVLGIIESHESKSDITKLGLDEVLIHIRNHTSDRDAWEMADHGLMILHNIKPITKSNTLLSFGPLPMARGKSFKNDNAEASAASVKAPPSLPGIPEP